MKISNSVGEKKTQIGTTLKQAATNYQESNVNVGYKQITQQSHDFSVTSQSFQLLFQSLFNKHFAWMFEFNLEEPDYKHDVLKWKTVKAFFMTSKA